MATVGPNRKPAWEFDVYQGKNKLKVMIDSEGDTLEEATKLAKMYLETGERLGEGRKL